MNRDDYEPDDLIDPDPFSVGLGIIQIFSAGVMFLEARRQTGVIVQGRREQFRGAYFSAKRSLIFFKQAVDEFETYMLEGGYARREFRIGVVRIALEPRQHQALRRLHGQVMTTAQHMADNIDDLSEFLGTDDQANVDALHQKAAEIQAFPNSYRDVIFLARDAMTLYEDLLEDIDQREHFGETDT